MYIATVFIPMLIVFPYLLINDPALLERRMRMRERSGATKDHQVIVHLFPGGLCLAGPGCALRLVECPAAAVRHCGCVCVHRLHGVRLGADGQ